MNKDKFIETSPVPWEYGYSDQERNLCYVNGFHISLLTESSYHHQVAVPYISVCNISERAYLDKKIKIKDETGKIVQLDDSYCNYDNRAQIWRIGDKKTNELYIKGINEIRIRYEDSDKDVVLPAKITAETLESLINEIRNMEKIQFSRMMKPSDYYAKYYPEYYEKKLKANLDRLQ